jgi:hypothetical protein
VEGSGAVILRARSRPAGRGRRNTAPTRARSAATASPHGGRTAGAAAEPAARGGAATGGAASGEAGMRTGCGVRVVVWGRRPRTRPARAGAPNGLRARDAGLASRARCESTGRRDLGRVRVRVRAAAVDLKGRGTVAVPPAATGDEGGRSSPIRSATAGIGATSGAGAGETAAGGGAGAGAAGAGDGRGGSNVRGST